jgi:thiosulfate dehydrogenase (quinone) large subunit
LIVAAFAGMRPGRGYTHSRECSDVQLEVTIMPHIQAADSPAWNVVWSYTVLRFTLGVTFLFHGVTRFVSGWSAFADQMVREFHDTFLPDFMVRPFALSTPPVEAALGTLLCLGLFTRSTLIAGGLWMIALVFGTTIRQDYPTVAIQLLYALLFFVLQLWESANRISLDALMKERRLK